MIAFLKLIRIQNLVIVAVTQYLMRFAIIQPILQVNNFSLQLSEFDFLVLVLSTIFLTAAGYVINDYFDTKTDSMNRPDDVVVGKQIERRTAMSLHIVLNILGIIGGFYVSYRIGLYQLGMIFIIVSGLLWYYSTSYKRQFLIGNLLVALLTGIVPLLPILYEMPLLNKTYKDILLANHTNFNHIFFWVLGFSFFAFITTLAREIIKDTEDFEGDSAYGRNTVPIVLGIKWTKTIIVSLLVIVLFVLVYLYFSYLESLSTLLYGLITLILPMFYLIYVIYKADDKNDYHFASTLLKFIMLAGILYSIVACCIFKTL